MDKENNVPQATMGSELSHRSSSTFRKQALRRATTTIGVPSASSTTSRRTTTSRYLRNLEENSAQPARATRFKPTSSFTSASTTSKNSRLPAHKSAQSLPRPSTVYNDQTRQMRSMQLQVESLTKLVESASDSASEMKQLLDSTRSEFEQGKLRLKAIEKEIAEKTQLVHQAKLNVKTHNYHLKRASMISGDDVDVLRVKESSVEEDVRRMRTEYEKFKSCYDDEEKRQTVERIGLQAKQADVKRLEEEIATLRREENTFEDERARFKTELYRLEAKVATFDAEREAILANVAKSVEVMNVLEAKKSDVSLRRKAVQNEIDALRAQYEETLSLSEKVLAEIEGCQKEDSMTKSAFEEQLREILDERVEIADKYKALIAERENLLEETTKSLAECTKVNEENSKTIAVNAAQLASLLEENNKLTQEFETTTRENEDKSKRIDDERRELRELELKSRELEKERRKVHNEVMELKGNIRVFCRVRPFIGNESQENKPHFSYDEEGTLGAKPPSGYRTDEQIEFKFDYVFDPKATQSDVFMEISQLVQSALDGYRVCIFAYGQTGSGKTHTMIGDKSAEQMGMIPRAVRQVFENASTFEKDGWTFEFKASFIEIYNETIRDLLRRGKSANKLELKMDAKSDRVDVPGLSTEAVGSTEKVLELIERANKNRATAATAANERSSRSHSVFVLHIGATHSETGEKLEGALNLVDLAGSERLENSKVEGERLKETVAINRSLSALSNVIVKLSDSSSKHVPFRDSKLTTLLRESLVGRSKVLMFVNISPQAASFQETVCSLRFARTVNACHVGTAKRNASAARGK